MQELFTEPDCRSCHGHQLMVQQLFEDGYGRSVVCDFGANYWNFHA
jgi:hypothetical protein